MKKYVTIVELLVALVTVMGAAWGVTKYALAGEFVTKTEAVELRKDTQAVKDHLDERLDRLEDKIDRILLRR